MAPKDFPRFKDGDITIRFTSDSEEYKLHSSRLSQDSDFFRVALDSKWDNGHQPQIVGGKRCWEYELRFETKSCFGMLQRVNLGATKPSATEFIATEIEDEVNASKLDKDVHEMRLKSIEAHKQLLSAMYHFQPGFVQEHFDKASCGLVRLLHRAAQSYGCEHVVKVYIETWLVKWEQSVLRDCVSNPDFIMSFATDVRCGWVFKEAASRIIASNNYHFDQFQAKLEERCEVELKNWLVEKRKKFRQALQNCEGQLFAIELEKDRYNSEEGHDVWWSEVAAGFFRSWLAKQLADGKGSKLDGDYAQPYDMITGSHMQSALESSPATKYEIQQYIKKLGIKGETDPYFVMYWLHEILDKAVWLVPYIREDNEWEKRLHSMDFGDWFGIDDDDLTWDKQGEFGRPEIEPDWYAR